MMSNSIQIALRNKAFLAQVYSLTTPYWRSEEKRTAWLLLAVVVALNYFIVEVAVFYSNWNRDFFNLMQNKEWQNFWPMLAQFAFIMAAYTGVDLAEEYLRRTLVIRWRRWLTNHYLSTWMGQQRLYRHQLAYPDSDNPDQRISQDIRDFCDKTLSMGLGLLRTVTSLFSFVIILWGLSGSLTIPVGSYQWVIPGYMVWVAILYSIVGTWLTHKIAKKLIPLNFEQEKSEADFRFHLMRARENAESIAIQRGENAELSRADGLFNKIWFNWQQLTGMKLRYGAFNSGYNELARIFPYLVASPRLMSGALQLGDMMQTATGFYRVQEAFSWFVDSYESIADWRAITERLVSFQLQLEMLPQQIKMEKSAQPEWHSLNLRLPEGRLLLENSSGTMEQSAQIRGASGSGKTTLLKALSGIWPYMDGHLAMPSANETMFIPQKPYIPQGTLGYVLSYPQEQSCYQSEAMCQALQRAGLSGLAEQLDVSASWQQRLSGGELQKLMLARCLLKQPKWLFLDESLSALDPESYRTVRQAFMEHMKDTKLIEISHRESQSSEDKSLHFCHQNKSLSY